MIRYRKLGYVELNVSSLARAREFYERIVGLQWVGTRSDGAELFRCDDEPYSVVLHEKSPAGFRRAGWMLEDESQFDTLHRKLRDHDVPYEIVDDAECGDRGIARATRIVEPNTRATLEFYVRGPASDAFAFEVSHTRILRLGHVVFSTPHRAAAQAFFREVLDFLDSDSIGEMASFMRPAGSPYHHGLGIGASEHAHFHHLNFMVESIDDVGCAMNRCDRSQVPVVYGPGRHPASQSVFLYFLDPDALTLEYSFGMEEFADDGARAARVLPPKPESVDMWGSLPDPRMGAVGEMDAAVIQSSPQ
ncbi:VOC family protein [Burkholderia sp. Bp9142]|uniref:VOC family protein n=1 Tax=Burkholderia sp. Bp9142 TaxID=2184573 RepID=UPI000F59F8B6|nr:VOC family protein [Burkholderia sp. Bp9142]RQR30135.1 glyoxalase [Burkholderia sp. Bp9142]